MFHFEILICMSKNIFTQPGMFCLSHDLGGNKTKQQGVHLFLEEECHLIGLTYAIQRFIQRMNCWAVLLEKDTAAHNERWVLQGPVLLTGFPASAPGVWGCGGGRHWP